MGNRDGAHNDCAIINFEISYSKFGLAQGAQIFVKLHFAIGIQLNPRPIIFYSVYNTLMLVVLRLASASAFNMPKISEIGQPLRPNSFVFLPYPTPAT